MLGYPVTEVNDEEGYGWSFLVGPLGLFKLKPSVYCLFQSGGEENKWLLITEQMRGAFLFRDNAYCKRVLDVIEAMLCADRVFTNLTPWITPKEYDRSEQKKSQEVRRQNREKSKLP